MFEWFFGKKYVEDVREETKKSFESVKKDINSVSSWIGHLNSGQNNQKKEIEEIKGVLSTIKEEFEEIKNIVAVMGNMKTKRVFKTLSHLTDKRTAVYAVQTGVQTPNLDQFSITERAILWILLNTEMKLSYDDLATMLGKEKSTIRGQINALKQKSESLIEEQIEKNGKKRVFISENIREKILKKTKVRVKSNKKNEG